MVTEVIIGDFRTGRRIIRVPWSSVRWSQRRNAPDACSVTIPLWDRNVRSMNLFEAASQGRAFLAIREGEYFAAAGQIIAPSYDRDSAVLTLQADGIWSTLYERTVLPPSAQTAAVEDFIVPDPADPTKTMSNPSLRTTFAGYDLGGIVVKLVEQAMAWDGFDVPIALPVAAAGTRTASYDAVAFKSLGEAISDITARRDGPDVRFTPRWQVDQVSLEYALEVGSEEQPRLSANTTHRWDASAKNPAIKGVKVSYDGMRAVSLGWAIGGRATDTVVVERSYDPTLIDAGYPLLEAVDSTHSDASLRETLQEYAAEPVRRGAIARELWTFSVNRNRKPRFGEYAIGDRCAIVMKDDPFIPDSPRGGYVRTIVGLDGDGSDWIQVTTAEE